MITITEQKYKKTLPSTSKDILFEFTILICK